MSERDSQGMRLRGKEMTRLEAFTDAAFAFSLTLLVISFDALPQSFEEFTTALKNIPGFAASFAQISMFWYAHHIWSRRYGLDDFKTALLTLAFVFVTLVYVYPLRIIFSAFFTWASGNRIPFVFDRVTPAELQSLFAIYGAGFVAMSALIGLHYWHALRAVPDLDPAERFHTRSECGVWAVIGATGLVQCILAVSMPAEIAPYSGCTYASLAIVMPLFGRAMQKKHDRLFPQADED